MYNSYSNIDSIVSALNSNDILYAIVPKTIYINEIFSNNYYIVHNVSELSSNYILDIKSYKVSVIFKIKFRW